MIRFLFKPFLFAFSLLLSLSILAGASPHLGESAIALELARISRTTAAVTSAPANAQPGDLVINEFMAANGRILADEDGDYSDWIELHNRSDKDLALQGIGLSDDPARPFRWTFPDMTMSPDQYLLVWASGKDRRDTPGELHTNFSIRAEGEPLLLTGPDGELLDQVEAIAVPRDFSYGRAGSEEWQFFDEPTAGVANITAGYTEILAPPAFSHPAGFYTAPFELELLLEDRDATILYTLDGSEPTADNLHGQTYTYKQSYPYLSGDPFGDFYTGTMYSHVYGGEPLQITERSEAESRVAIHAAPPEDPIFKGTVVRARTIKEGAFPSDIATHTYFVTPEGPGRYGLPVLALTSQEDRLFDYYTGIYNHGMDFDEWRLNNPEGIVSGHEPGNYRRAGREWEVPVHLELFEPAAGRVLSQNLGMRIHGGWSRHLPQKSLRLYARRDYDTQNVLAYPFFPHLVNRYDGAPITEFRRLVLRNSGNDSQESRIRDVFLHRLLAPLGLDHQADRPAIHFINGEYWGLINIRERIDPHYIAARYGIAAEDVAILEEDAELNAGDESDRQDFLELRGDIGMQDITDSAYYAHVQEQMDIDNFIRYHVGQIYIRNTDWPHNNVRVWRTTNPDPNPGDEYWRDGRWRWILYDLDRGFLEPEHNTLAWATHVGGYNDNNQWSTLMLRLLLQNPEFRTRFINTMADSMNTIFRPHHALAVIDATYAEIAPYVPEHAARWSDGDIPPHQFRVFAQARPEWMIQHMLEYFDLPGIAEITLDVSDPAHGYLRLTATEITEQVPGLLHVGQPYPWQGTYYRDVPVTVTAVAHPGYAFTGWLEYPDEVSPRIEILPEDGLTLTAQFAPIAAQLTAEDGARVEPHIVQEGPFALTAWPASSPAGTWPDHMRFTQTPVQDPGLDVPLDGVWTLAYDLDSRSRIIGLDADGIGFLNTGNPQADAGAGYVGAAAVALDTRGVDAVEISWLAGTVLANQRQYGLRLQYRIGADGEFRDVPGPDGQPVEYLSAPQDGHTQRFDAIALPPDAQGRPLVEVRWRYYHVGGDSGPRALIRLDEIEIAGQSSRGN